MKKILLATTVLVGTAGFAAAEITLSGSAAMGFGRDGDNTVANAWNDGDFHVYNSAKIAFAASTETDNGLSLSMSTDVSVGTAYTFADDEGFEEKSGIIGAPKLTLSSSFGTLTFKDDGIDHLYNDDIAGDVAFDYAAGDFSLGLVADVDDTYAANTWSAKAGYAINGVSLAVVADDESSYNVAVGYTFGSITATVDTDSDAGADAVNTLTVAYSADGITGEVSVDSDDGWSLALGYSANGVGVNVSTDDASAWAATASYDLGGGASVEGGVNHADDAYAGVKFSF